MAGGKA